MYYLSFSLEIDVPSLAQSSFSPEIDVLSLV